MSVSTLYIETNKAEHFSTLNNHLYCFLPCILDGNLRRFLLFNQYVDKPFRNISI